MNYTLSTNGIVRNTSGKIVAYFDKDAKTLDISGYTQTYQNIDTESLMFDVLVHIAGNKYMEVA